MSLNNRRNIIIGLVLAVVLVLGAVALAGCGSGTTTTTAAAVTTTVAASSTDTTAAVSSTDTTAATTATTVAANVGAGKKIIVATAVYGSAAVKECVDDLVAEAKAAGYSIEIRDTAGDFDKLIGVYDTAISEKADFIVNAFVDINQLQPAYAAALKAGVPVIGLDANKDPKQVTNIQSDNTIVGTLMADNLAKAIGEKGNIVEFTYDAHPGVNERMRAAEAVFKAKYPNIKIISVHAIKYPGATEDGTTAMANYLTANPKGTLAGGIFGFDEAANGAALAIRSAGRTADVKIVSCDATAQFLADVVKPDSPWVGSVAQDWKAISQTALDTITATLAGHGPALGSNTKVPPVFVTKDNAAQFVR